MWVFDKFGNSSEGQSFCKRFIPKANNQGGEFVAGTDPAVTDLPLADCQ
jgi:hypothetical protein